MPNPITDLSFDYGSLDTGTAQFVKQQTTEIKGLFKQTVENIVAIGTRLLKVKERLAHGEWLDWLEAEFDWTDRTALNFMNVAQQFKSEIISDLNIAATALYVLAAPNTSVAAREEAITRAQSGERITVSSAKELRDKYAPAKPEVEVQILPLDPGYQSIVGTQTSQPAPPVQEFTPQTQFSAPTPVQQLPRAEFKAVIHSKRKRAKAEKSLIVAPKRVQLKEWWKLGHDNYLYCGDPASTEFQKMLPESIALSLLSPPSQKAWSGLAPSNATSAVSVLTAYEEDQDLSLLREIVERYILLYTDPAEDENTVALSFLPDPAVLPLLQQLDCRFFCADPDPKRCDAAITVWTTIGQNAERMKTRQGKKRLSSPALSR